MNINAQHAAPCVYLQLCKHRASGYAKKETPSEPTLALYVAYYQKILMKQTKQTIHKSHSLYMRLRLIKRKKATCKPAQPPFYTKVMQSNIVINYILLDRPNSFRDKINGCGRPK